VTAHSFQQARFNAMILESAMHFNKKFIKCDDLSRYNPVLNDRIHYFGAMKLVKMGRGRPKKYGRDSRAVTITLPEDVLLSLRALDADIGRAIVRLVERQGTTRASVAPPAEISAYGRHAVIVVKPMKALKRLPGVQLVPVGNGRALLSLDQPLSISQLELAVRDALEGSEVSEPERQALQAIADILRQARSSRTVAVGERTIIVLESKRRARR
jgi:hypothetical protein